MGVPIYMRIQQFILDKIKSGEWAPGATIPTETELGRQFGCSRVTVAMALRELVKDGAIYRIQGKGSFVSAPKAKKEFYTKSSLSEIATSVDDLSIPGEHKSLGVAVEEPSPEVASVLRLREGQRVVVIDRVKYVDGAPFCAEQLFLPELIFAPVVEEQLGELTFAELARRCDVTPGKTFVSSQPVICDERVALMMGVDAGTPILRFCFEIDDVQGHPIACEFAFVEGKQERKPL
ncbi:MAG: GntR family transcriptional regulator [Pyramidobacter sp.]|nr:GntR family transcriptional regulator [Pyramidobacter sp.]